MRKRTLYHTVHHHDVINKMVTSTVTQFQIMSYILRIRKDENL